MPWLPAIWSVPKVRKPKGPRRYCTETKIMSLSSRNLEWNE